MRKTNRTFQSFYEHQYQNALTTKRNLSQVQGILTVYQKNNKSLISQVQDLIRQNQMLKKTQINTAYSTNINNANLSKSNLTTSYKQNRSALTQANKCLQSISQHSKITNHPRDIYLDHSALKKQNVGAYTKIRQMQKKYQNQKGFTKHKFNQKVKKQQTKRSNNNLQISRRAYLEQGSLQINSGQIEQNVKEGRKTDRYIKIRDSFSPIDFNNKDEVSPCNRLKSKHDFSKSKTDRQFYYDSNIKLKQPSTKWKDIASGVLQKERSQNKQMSARKTQKTQNQTNWQSKQLRNLHKQQKKKRKQFLSLVSNMIE